MGFTLAFVSNAGHLLAEGKSRYAKPGSLATDGLVAKALDPKEVRMKGLTVLFTLTLGIPLLCSAGAAPSFSVLPGGAAHFNLPPMPHLIRIPDLVASLWASPSDSAAGIQQPPAAPDSKDVDVTVKVSKEKRAWYLSPVWMAIGGLGALLVIILIVMAARGGGTTVVRG